MSSTDRSGSSVVAKRLLVGRAFSSSRLEHTLLPKVLALPVFASDALSSVAYATGEILLALTLVTAAPQPYVMPIAVAIALLLAIVVGSYRQTVRAYPGGGGAYIVSKENLGQFAGLVAASALLFDYMMTVVVSIVAGVVAIQSAFPEAAPYAVPLCVFFVAFVTIANLRGSKESGVVFAIPTYGFVLAIGTLVLIGLVRCTTGCPAIPEGVEIEPIHDAATVAGTVGVFALLKAFSSGATALTGVEAISNGVPAFKRPQAHNAATTLAIMGGISISLFLGISWLATHVDGVTASEQRSVPSQIAIAIFGEGSIGFFVVQFFTSAILILAANTAYQDFPRLASILARDRFLPSQFVNRGDRLVFSNGVIVLGLASATMIWIFDASLTAVIHLYVVGVFTSFTLSQAGMIRHWIAEGRQGNAAMRGWRRSIVINAVGCVITGVVLVVVILSKFGDGAWLSILLMALLVPAFYGIHHHYGWVRSVLRRGVERPDAPTRNHVVLLVHDLDASTAEAVGYLKSFRPEEVHVVAATRDGTVPNRLVEQWPAFAGSGLPAPAPLPHGGLTHAMRTYVAGITRSPGDLVTVMVPEVVRGSLLRYLLGRRDLVRLKASMLREPGVVVTDVPVAVEPGEPVGVGRIRIPARTVTLVFVSSVNDLTIKAVRYAKGLGAGITRAIYFDVDPEQAHRLEEAWFDSGLEVPLDIVEAPFRDLSIPMLQEVRRFSSRSDTIVNVVIPEAVVTRWWQLPLHNQNALFIKRLFLYEDRVILTSVPFVLHRHPEDAEGVTSPA
jgi:amino acid transporter